jgi:hypothetical protein
MQADSSRRDFFSALFSSVAAASLAQPALAQQDSAKGIPTRRLGRTNEQVSILCLGGWHIGSIPGRQESIRIMHAALDEGITFFDNAWDYHDGRSEEVMGEALAAGGRRERVFLMTKNCERDCEGSKRCLEDSLRRLRTGWARRSCRARSLRSRPPWRTWPRSPTGRCCHGRRSRRRSGAGRPGGR